MYHAFHGNEWMKERNYALQNADTRPRLQSRTQNMFCYLDFLFWSEAISQNHIHFPLIQVLKNSMSWHFLTFTSPSSKLEFVHPSCCGVEDQMLIFSSSLTPRRVKGSWNPISKLTIVLMWKTPACFKFGKTSNRAENSESEQQTMHDLTHRTSSCLLFELCVAQCILVKSGAVHSGEMRCILVKSDEFENSSHLIYFSQILIMLLLACCARSAAIINVSNERCLKKKPLLANLLQRTVFPSNLCFLAGNRFCTKFDSGIGCLTYHLQIKWWWIFLGFLRRMKTKMSKEKSLKTRRCSRHFTCVKKKKERKHECTKRSDASTVGHFLI